jgi:hypothetical protein
MRHRTPKGLRLRLPAPPTPDYVYVACEAREQLGIAALAEELGLTAERTKALIWADQTAGSGDAVYASYLDRGDVILATRAGLPVNQVEDWTHAGFDFVEYAPCPAALRRVLDALLETVH